MISLSVANIIAIAGVFLTLLGMLVGVIWAMLNNKLKLIVEKTKKNSDNIDSIKQMIHDVELGEAKVMGELNRHFMRKEECEKEHRLLVSQLKNNEQT